MKKMTPVTSELKSALSSFWKGSINWDVNMAKYSTFKSGGKAAALIELENLAELQNLLTWLHANKLAWRIIGRGSNILVSDSGFSGVIIRLQGDFNSIKIDQANQRETNKSLAIHAGAGCSITRLLSFNTQHSLTGLEFMTGIPGSLGGAICMNAGAWGKSIGATLQAVTFSDQNGILHKIKVADIHFTYRRMQLKTEWGAKAVITGADFRLEKGDQQEIVQTCRNIMEKRRKKQPANLPSAGSFFKNPQGDSAGRLIEAAGLKGLQKGNAMVSHNHANFIVNTGSASPGEIAGLMQEVQRKVYNFSGIMLEPEVHFL